MAPHHRVYFERNAAFPKAEVPRRCRPVFSDEAVKAIARESFQWAALELLKIISLGVAILIFCQ